MPNRIDKWVSRGGDHDTDYYGTMDDSNYLPMGVIPHAARVFHTNLWVVEWKGQPPQPKKECICTNGFGWSSIITSGCRDHILNMFFGA